MEMKHPGVWVLGDIADDDRRHGMGIVVEYAGHSGKPVWMAPPAFRWDYMRFGKPGAAAASPDETFEMLVAKDNAAEEGFNGWTINGAAFSMMQAVAPASFHLRRGKRYRIRLRNANPTAKGPRRFLEGWRIERGILTARCGEHEPAVNVHTDNH
jgi:hypothetical protein